MFFLWYFLLTISNIVVARSPVIIIPGTGGSQLDARLVGKPTTPAWYCYSKTSSYFKLWLDIKSLAPYAINCWVDNIRLEWNMKTMTVSNAPGVVTRTPGFGDTSSIESLDSLGLIKYMYPLVKFLTNMGYQKGKDLRGAPYDFRYSPDHLPDNYHIKLKNLVEETYGKNGKQKVTLISHSYGCPVTLYFLSLQTTQWKRTYIKQWVPLSGVFGGTLQEVQLYASGHLQGIPGPLVNRLTIRGEQRSSTSNLFMLPSASLWPKDDIMVKTKSRSYKISQMNDFLVDIGFPEGVNMRSAILNTTYLMSTSPDVPIYCFYGNIPSSIVNQLEFTNNFPDSPSKILNGAGDGTVNLESLQLCKQFHSKPNSTVIVEELPRVNHNGVMSHANVFKTLQKIL